MKTTRALRTGASRLVAAAMILLVCTFAASAERLEIGVFAPGALTDWQPKSFEGETEYRLTGAGDVRALSASCNGTASALARRVPIDLKATPVLHWQWRVDGVHEGLNEQHKTGDDFAARVYVIHDGGVLKWRSRAINYVWAGNTKRGRHWPNPFTDKAMMVAVESGAPADTSAWASESRNVRADFKRFYALNLDTLDAVAVMTDCDNTGGSASAAYRQIHFAPK